MSECRVPMLAQAATALASVNAPRICLVQTGPTQIRLAHPSSSHILDPTTSSKQTHPVDDEALIAHITTHKLFGVDVNFPDGSIWTIGDTLSEVELLQEHSPCTGRQAFAAHLKSDPSELYVEFSEAVIQIDFQTLATTDKMQHYQEQLYSCARRLKENPEDRDTILQDIYVFQTALENGREPTTEPGATTYNELFALSRFADHECESAPWLFNLVETTVRDQFHYAAVPGGFMILALLPTVRGERLTFHYLQNLTPEMRDRVREAFKVALKNIWACGIYLSKTDLHNIIWHEKSETCCIVDFKDCRVPKAGAPETKEFDEVQYEYWRLDEELYKVHHIDD